MSTLLWLATALGTTLLTALPSPPSEQYVGAETCAACHREKAQSHARSPHGNTWRPVSTLSALPELPQSVREGDVLYSVREVDGEWRYEVQMGDRPLQSFPIHSVIGGSRFGRSFLFEVREVESSPLGRPTLVEGRWMLAASGRMKLAPGFPDPVPGNYEVALGRALSPLFADKCLSCHLGPVDPKLAKAGRPRPPLKDNAVTCERCHGPGAGHVEAVSEGADDLRIVHPGKLSNADLMKICRDCHGGFFQEVRPRPGHVLIASQALALEKSECYVQSGGGLTCIDCHDPHRSATAGEAGYQSTCLRCHGPSGDAGPCPVNSATGCIPCHMPKTVHPGNFELFDHWIRVAGR